jgi:hypothetical protein
LRKKECKKKHTTCTAFILNKLVDLLHRFLLKECWDCDIKGSRRLYRFTQHCRRQLWTDRPKSFYWRNYRWIICGVFGIEKRRACYCY